MHIINLEDRIASASLEHFNEEIAFHWLGNFCHFLLTDFLLGAMYELITKCVQIWRFIISKYTSKGILYNTEESYALKGSLNSNCN